MQPASLGIHADFFLPLDVSNPIQWQPIANHHRDLKKEHLLGQDCNSHNAGVGQHCEAAIAQLLRAWDLHLILEMQGTVWSGLKCVDRITVFER